MEILIAIAPLFIFVVFSVIILIQEWITDMWFYRRRHLKEIRRSLGKVECVKHTLPTGEVETLGPGEIYIFDKQKIGKVTGIANKEEMVSEAERLIKEARDKSSLGVII